MLQFQLGEVVNIGLFRTNNSGVGQTTACSYKIFEADTGVQIATGQLTHMGGAGGATGYHRAQWTPNNTVSKGYLVIIYDGVAANGATLDSFRLRVVSDVKDIQGTIDLGDGQIA